MFDEIHEYASAKINLNLKVYPRRLDGFHAIESIFQTVNLQDELIVSPAEGKMNCIVNCSSMVLPELNTLNLAYKAFAECHIRLVVAKIVEQCGHNVYLLSYGATIYCSAKRCITIGRVEYYRNLEKSGCCLVFGVVCLVGVVGCYHKECVAEPFAALCHFEE